MSSRRFQNSESGNRGRVHRRPTFIEMVARWSIAGLALGLLISACTSTTAPTTPTTTTVSGPSSTLPRDPAQISADAEKGLPQGGPVLAGAPEVVADRSPLPYCGATLLSPNTGVNPFPAIELVDDAVDCYRARAEAGQPAEMVEIGWTTEGDPILHIRRLLPDGREETFSDMTRDAFGIRAWFRLVCPRYQPLEGTCEPVEQLPLGELAGPSTTLFDITTADAETGPPFYLDAEPLTPGESDVWATHELTITSEWRTPIAVAIPPTEFVLDSRQLNGAPEGQLQSEPTVLHPGESLRLVLELKPRFPDGPVAGVYEIEVPLSYWRNVDAAVGPTGPPENTLTLNIRYDVLDARTVSAIETFCDRAVETAADLTKIDQELLTDGLDTIEAAAVELPQQRGEQLVTEIQALRLRLDTWFSPDPGHSGFSTGPIIDITNHLCGTKLQGFGVQA